MLHLGLSEQYEFKEFDDSTVLMRLELTPVSIPKILLIFLGVRIK
jgi:hypothetical protein